MSRRALVYCLGMWFVYALLATLAWGVADLFYKRGAKAQERYTHLKTSIVVGLVMGAHAIITLLSGNIGFRFINLLLYLPVSLLYILSMTVGYLGLRYLELSICSPIQNASGAVTCLLCLIVLGQRMDGVTAAAVAVICLGVFLLGLFERKREKLQPRTVEQGERKYRVGFFAFLLPLLYCVIDALGTFFDAYYLDDAAATPLVGVTADTLESVANTAYELTFLIVALILIVYVYGIKHEKPRALLDRDRWFAALFETGGQFAYVYAMSGGSAVVAAPMIASYSIVSVLLSRLFLKEKLTKWQYVAVSLVLMGIAALGVVEGLGGE